MKKSNFGNIINRPSRTNFCRAKNWSSEIRIFIIVLNINLRVIKKHGVDSAIQFREKSILRHMVFTETTRQRGSLYYMMKYNDKIFIRHIKIRIIYF